MLTKKEEPSVIYVLLNSEGKGLAVKGTPYSRVLGSIGLPMLALCAAHSVYDATNDTVLKWRSPKDMPFESMRPTMQLLAANPKGVLLRGRSALAAGLVKAYVSPEPDPTTIVWRRVAVADPDSGVIFPHPLIMHDVIFHPDDEELAAQVINKNGVAA